MHGPTALAMPGADAPTPARLAALAAAGGIAYWRYERERSNDHYREQLALAQQLGDMAATADASLKLASTTFVVGNLQESADALREARRLYVQLGDERSLNRADWGATDLMLDAEGPAAMLAALGPIHERTVALDDAAYLILVEGTCASFMMGDFNAAARWGIHAMLGSYGIRDVAGSTIALPIAAIVAIEFGLTRRRPFSWAPSMACANATASDRRSGWRR